ncbi:hypothetical protein BDN70DRAFT_861334 [Pholiota conissans]|uniref:Uncharacterized protein n=1 Tax=Pholiota conissans TaxID=109636 RepID=A0A9P5YZZ1_9AGAR|nr:hypothetical protein BDN70DRAFT_861334 [Pholiota conissans]
MPFSTDTSWPPGLLKIFEPYRSKRPEDYILFGHYDKLLNYCFGDSFEFFVLPQNPLGDDISRDIDLGDFAAFLIVVDTERRPVLIAEVKDKEWAASENFRFEADKQLRRWYDFLSEDCVHPRLWGLSLLGTSVRVYSANTATGYIEPPYKGRTREGYIIKEFLKEEWNMDILSQKGFDKMKEIVEDINIASAAL